MFKSHHILIYNIVVLLLLPVILLNLLIRMLTGKEDPIRALERFNLSQVKPVAGAQYLWFHAASIGESKIALDLIRALIGHPIVVRKGYKFLITTQTRSSARIIAQEKKLGVTHQYMPYDLPVISAAFMKKWNIKLAIFIEKEIWPLHLYNCRARILLVNARISETAAARWGLVRYFARSFFARFSAVYTATIEDNERLIRFYRRAELLGNIKLGTPVPQVSKAQQEALKKAYKKSQVITFASTDKGEIEGVAKVITDLYTLSAKKKEADELSFIWAPRHREDLKAIEKKLQRFNIPYRVRSQYATPLANAVYIIDTYNELGLFYSVSDIVFVGGSLCSRGGQNMLEPIRLGALTLTGYNTKNFIGIMEELRSHNAIEEVDNFFALRLKILRLLENQKEAELLRENIKQFNNKSSRMMEQYLQRIEAFL